jgi:hypothetical protein
MLDAKLGGSLGLKLGQLSEVVPKALDAASVKASPKRWFAHRDTTHTS